MEVPGPSHNVCSVKASQVFPPHFDGQAAKKTEDQCTLSLEFVELMRNTCQSMEKDFLKAKMLVNEYNTVSTQPENFSLAQRIIRFKRRIAAMEAINDLKLRVAVNNGIQRRLLEFINASKDEIISDSEIMGSQSFLATGDENSQKEKTGGLAVEHEFTFMSEFFDTMKAILECFCAINLETTEPRSFINALLKKYIEMENTSKECAYDGKQVSRQLNGGGMETLMGASSSSSTDCSPSYDEMSDVSSSDKDDVKMQDAETTEVSIEADPSPPLNPSNTESEWYPHITE